MFNSFFFCLTLVVVHLLLIEIVPGAFLSVASTWCSFWNCTGFKNGIVPQGILLLWSAMFCISLSLFEWCPFANCVPNCFGILMTNLSVSFPSRLLFAGVWFTFFPLETKRSPKLIGILNDVKCYLWIYYTQNLDCIGVLSDWKVHYQWIYTVFKVHISICTGTYTHSKDNQVSFTISNVLYMNSFFLGKNSTSLLSTPQQPSLFLNLKFNREDMLIPCNFNWPDCQSDLPNN